MALYVACKNCNGRGSFPCDNCLCKNCDSKGKIKCSVCSYGYVPCSTCNATGQVPRKVLFFTVYDPCPQCRRAKRLPCRTCNQSGVITCSSCNGTGRYAQCSKCKGTKEITCSECSGKRQFPSEWLKSLPSLPVERLRFEHDKRRSEVANLQMQNSRLEMEYEQIQSDWGNALSDLESRYGAERGIKMFDASGYQNASNVTLKRMSQAQGRISELEAEMKAIEQVIEKKWK